MMRNWIKSLVGQVFIQMKKLGTDETKEEETIDRSVDSFDFAI